MAKAGPGGASSLGLAQPDPESNGLDGGVDRLAQIGRDRLDVDLVAQPLGERGCRSLSVDPCAIETPVDDRLDPPPDGLEQRRDDERGQRHGDRVAAEEGPERARRTRIAAA